MTEESPTLEQRNHVVSDLWTAILMIEYLLRCAESGDDCDTKPAHALAKNLREKYDQPEEEGEAQ